MDLFFYILYYGYRLLLLQNSERHFQNCALSLPYVTTFYMQHCAVARFVFKTVTCL